MSLQGEKGKITGTKRLFPLDAGQTGEYSVADL
jgi:hypothetical protein